MITRKDYLAEASMAGAHRPDGLTAHDKYYSQFVTDSTIRTVEQRFGAIELRRSFNKSSSFHDIRLGYWDALCFTENPGRGFTARLPFNRQAVAEAGETVTRAVLVCIAKAAARKVIAA